MRYRELLESTKPSLVPAILYHGVIFRGEKGQQHVQIAHEYGMPQIASDGERGFVNADGTFFNRTDALQYAKDNHLIDPNTKATQLMSDQLVEAPISDIELKHEDPNQKFGKGTSFDDLDTKLVQSKPHIDRIVRAFTKTPHTFKVVFLDNDRINAENSSDNADPDKWAADMDAGIHKEYMGVKGTPGIITVVLVSNLAPKANKIPMTPWTVAHKVGHSFQDAMNEGTCDAPIQNTMYRIYRQFAFIAADGDAEEMRTVENYYHKNANATYPYIFDSQRMFSKMTMKSARTPGKKGINDNSFEVFAELIAQYLIQGKVIMAEMDDYRYVNELNELFDELFEHCYGYVMSEV